MQECEVISARTLSDVFRMDHDLYVVWVRDREEARDRSFEEVEELVRADLTEMRHYELTARMEADLVATADAKVYDYTLRKMLKEEARAGE